MTNTHDFTKWFRLVLAAAMAIAVGLAITPNQVANAAVLVVAVDDAGPDDEPGQKDLNSLSVDYGDPGATNIAVTYNFDNTSTTGANTLDGCALFDTDADGFANYSQCHTIASDGTQTMSQYVCGADSRSDRCGGPTQVVGFVSTSSASIVSGSDPFQGVASHNSNNQCKTFAACVTDDYVVTADIAVIADFGASALLINVCSYPSREPNSDPSDCVFSPENGFLTIVKTTDETTSQEFVFDVSEASADGSTQFSTTGAGTVSTISYAPTSTLDITEVVPAEWTLASASCAIQTATPTPTGSAVAAGVADLEIRSGLATVCTFDNDKRITSLTLVKNVINDNGGGASAADWTLTADGGPTPISGAGSVTSGNDFAAGTYDLSESAGPSGYQLTSLTCDNSGDAQVSTVTVQIGEQVTCTFVNDDDAPSLTLVKQVVNNNGGSAVPGDFTLVATGYDAVSPQTGTYDLSESGPAGYTQTSLTCSNSVGQVTSATLGLGEDVTCTFVNDDDGPGLTLIKQVVNDNGGTAVPGDFTLVAAGYDPLDPQAGTYDLSESGPAGYTQTSLTCSNSVGQVTSVTIGLGESVTCTFVNDDDAPSLTLMKIVTNDNGGTAAPGDFTLVAGGYDTASPDAGTYDLSESGPAGYTQTSLTCSNSVGQVNSVTLALGESVTCTFVNDDDAPSLTLVKQVVNNNGGSAVPGDFTLVATGYDAVSPQTGTYDLSESGPAGYTQTSLTCSNSVGQVTSATLGLGEDVTCTFVNDDDGPGLTLIKQVVNDNGGTAVPGDFTLVAAGYDPLDPQAGTYDLSESGPAGYTQTSLTCSNSVGQVTSVTIGLGESVTCTFVNDDDAPSLTLVKQVVNNNGGTAAPGDFTLVATGFDPLDPQTGTYDLSESGPSGYTQTSLTCSNSVGQVNSVTLALGESVTCTFVNDDDAPSLTLVKQVVNNNGGSAVPGDFTLVATGYDEVSPDAGEYPLSETGGPAGYTQTSLTCSNSVGQVTSATLALGEDVTCTFVNDDDAPSLTLVKQVVNDNGGTAVAGDWTLTATGFDPLDPQTGTYDLSESGPAGYTQTSLTCSNSVGQVTSVTLALGEDVTCTFVNDDDAPSLTLVKQVVNNNGGTAVAGDWTLTATGYDEVSPDAGEYPLSETGGPAGYTQTSLTCSNSVGQVTSVTLALGESVTCTFVNDDDAPSLTLVKQVVNDNGGTAVAGDWTLTATGYDAVSPQTGTYVLSESGPAGYTQTSLTCSNSVGQVTSVTLALGEDVTCTFVNDDDAPSLTLIKQVVNDNGGTAVAGDWTLTATGYDAVSPQTGTYDLSESGPAGYTQTSLTCSNSAGQVTSVTLALGEDVTCTFVNDDDAPSLTLIKQVVNNNGGTAVAGDWTLTATGYDRLDPQAGTYDLSESGPTGYTQISLTCDNVGGDVTSVTLGLGEDVTCTFVNDDDGPGLTLIKQVVNDNGGTAVAGDWTLTATGYDPLDPQAGTYDLSESGPAGYTQTSLTCSNSVGQVDSVTIALGESVVCTFVNDDDAPSLTLIKEVVNDNGGAAAAGDWALEAAGYDAASPDAGEYLLSETGGPAGYTQTSLTCSNSVGQVTSVTLALGEDVTCTFVNDDDAPLLTLIKEVVNDDGGEATTADFVLTAAGPTGISGISGVTSGDSFAAGTYDLSETGLDGYSADAWVCDGGEQEGSSVTLAVGESATCTIVNDDEPIDLELTKDDGGVEAVAGGAPFDYTISVRNIGNRDVDLGEPVTVTDELPVGLIWVSFPANCSQAGQTLTCDVDPAALPAGGDAVVITATVRAEAGAPSGIYVNKASVTTEDDTTTGPPCPAAGDNNVDCEETPVDRQGGIQIIKTDDVAEGESVQPGDTFTYQLVVTNTGVSTILPGTHVEDDLPAQLEFVSAVGGAGWTCNDASPVDCDYAPELAPGQSAPAITVTVTVAADANGSTIDNVAVVIAAVDRDCPSATSRLVESFTPACNQITDDDDETTPLVASADLAIAKTASVELVGAGGGFDWTLDVTNHGPGTATNVVIGDLVPSSLTVTGVASSDFACGNSGNDVSCTIASLAVGASGTVTITVTVPLATADGDVINVGTVESDTPDPDLTNNSDDATVTIVAQAPPTTTLPPVTLPRTGSDATQDIVRTALMLMLLGGAVVLITRRRCDDGVAMD